ncbi:hypothetical protein CF168_13460 [Shewanella bicestrii]|uniref:Uncharacterized protein n=1 Tax=Shewanella bicestrii TaxID=2018305 RepID=A0A220UNJ0_9GAMM|nr:conserved hypothetical protein [Shewanella sp. ANA-3]ASK69787.1 hypothetical protein CF168_13460 [Shewanella bicestrii]
MGFMFYVVVALSVSCSWCFGVAAFRVGLSVSYWAVMGFILGPLAFPLFSSHKRIALSRMRRTSDASLTA